MEQDQDRARIATQAGLQLMTKVKEMMEEQANRVGARTAIPPRSLKPTPQIQETMATKAWRLEAQHLERFKIVTSPTNL